MTSPAMFIFYFCTIIIGTYIVLNMFVGVFVDGYMNASEHMREDARVRKQSVVKPLKIVWVFDEPEGWLRRKINETLSTTQFDLLSVFMIVLNVVFMSFESYKQASWQTDLGELNNIFFTMLFGSECIFKLYTYRGAHYSTGGWNRFDFFIVIISYFGFAIDNAGANVGINPNILRVLRIARIFRILRAFKAFKAAKKLQKLIFSLAKALPQLANLVPILLMVFFIFSSISVALYGTICVQGEDSLPGMGAVRCALAGDMKVGLRGNFRHMGEALGTLFRMAIVGDAWGDILEVLGTAPALTSHPISAYEWQRFTDVLGYDPRDASEARYNHKLLLASSARIEMAKIAIRSWNTSVFGMDSDIDWPAPIRVPQASELLSLARMALPGCLTDDIIFHLEKEGLVDCSQVTQDPTVSDPPASRQGSLCQSTCALGGEWSYVISSFFFSIFIAVSSFACLQLVIAMLMDQLNDADDDDAHRGRKKVPTCQELEEFVFKRLFRRFLYNAKLKLCYLSELQKRASAATTIQRRTRGMNTRKNFGVHVAAAKAKRDERASAATTIQRRTRGMNARKNLAAHVTAAKAKRVDDSVFANNNNSPSPGIRTGLGSPQPLSTIAFRS